MKNGLINLNLLNQEGEDMGSTISLDIVINYISVNKTV